MNANKFKNPTSPLFSPKNQWAPVAGVVDEWHPVTIATIENVEQVIKTLTEAINGKHGPLKNKLVFLRIKPEAIISIVRCGHSEPGQIKEEGWDVDQAVINSIEFVNTEKAPGQLTVPIAFINFDKITINQYAYANPAAGFWFQLADLEWRMV